jgi:hypothetical protein
VGLFKDPVEISFSIGSIGQALDDIYKLCKTFLAYKFIVALCLPWGREFVGYGF